MMHVGCSYVSERKASSMLFELSPVHNVGIVQMSDTPMKEHMSDALGALLFLIVLASPHEFISCTVPYQQTRTDMVRNIP